MTPERWKQIEEVFQTALDLPAGERQQYVVAACAGDDELCAQVAALVAQHEEAGDFIEAPALAATGLRRITDQFATSPTTSTFDDPAIGRRIGAYQITREIGRGGMGAVYLAERVDSAFRHRVAIKLIKRGMDTDFILRRFRNERQILATLDHQHIAKLLDGGTTEDGLPYFVMEFIPGQPIYRYCDERKLPIMERLRLLCQVCEAVAYAHRSHVIHRDLKPSNILVTADGVPKLLDFGIAKVLDPGLVADITLDPTATAMRLMTPEYASPEQVQGAAITPATDVYSLGVLLYELLTGHRPYRLHNRAPHEIARVICDEEPAPLSAVISRPDDMLFAVAPPNGEETTLNYLCWNRGGATVESLRRELSGDIENIVMKALRKEPAQRYQSVEHLRDDITRHLDGRPVSAPPYFHAAIHMSASPDSGSGERSLAVLPLKLLDARRTEDTGDEYLGIGLADALITRLSSVRRFTVRPTSSVLRYNTLDSDPLAAGRDLRAAFVLDGRIRRAGESIRITVQLLDVRTSATTWAGQFDEKFTDVLTLEDAITAQVAEAIVPHLTGDERQRLAKRGTDNPAAHEAYMRGRYHWNSMTEDGFAKSLIYFTRAVAIDANYALAYAGIADYYNFLGIYAVLPFRECAAAAQQAALKAVELDDTLAEGHAALGFATLTHDFDWTTAERQHRHSLELNPNYPHAHLWYSFYLAMSARFDESLVEVRRALELDPYSPIIHHTLSWNLYFARRYDDSIAAARRLITLEPGYGLGLLFLGLKLRYAGELEEAAAIERRTLAVLGRTPFVLTWMAAGLAASGEHEQARELLREIEAAAAAARYVSPYLLALVYCNLGEPERALDELERALAINDGWLVWLGVEPRFDPLRGEPRFESLLRQTGNPATLSHGDAAPVVVETQDDSAQPPAQSGSRDSARLPTHTVERPSIDPEAQQLYVAGRYYSTKRTAEGLRQAIERLERAVERDPNFALAYSELADCYALLNWYVEPPPPEAFARAKQAALRAVAADDTLAEAHASLGFVKLHYDRNWAGAEREFRRAIELKSDNAPAHRWYAFSLAAMGRHDEAFAEIRRAQAISPRSPVIATGVANVLFLARRFDETIAQCRKALELDPGSVAAYVVLRWAYERKGLRAEALAAYEQERVFAGDTPTTKAKHAHVLAATGRRAEARQVLDELLARREEQWVTAYEIAIICALLDDRDSAFRWLAQAEREHAVGFTFVRVDPHLDNLRGDPRFLELVRRLDESPTA